MIINFRFRYLTWRYYKAPIQASRYRDVPQLPPRFTTKHLQLYLKFLPKQSGWNSPEMYLRERNSHHYGEGPCQRDCLERALLEDCLGRAVFRVTGKTAVLEGCVGRLSQKGCVRRLSQKRCVRRLSQKGCVRRLPSKPWKGCRHCTDHIHWPSLKVRCCGRAVHGDGKTQQRNCK